MIYFNKQMYARKKDSIELKIISLRVYKQNYLHSLGKNFFSLKFSYFFFSFSTNQMLQNLTTADAR